MMHDDKSPRWYWFGAAVAIFLGTLLIYSHGVGGPLLFDDVAALSVNERVQIDGRVFDDWRVAAYSSTAGPLSRPVAMLTFAANHAFFEQLSPTTLKGVNVLIHLLTGWLVFLVCQGVLGALGRPGAEPVWRWLALLAAGIWLLHPLHVSTVLYAVQRMAQLSTLFVLLGLWVFLRYRLRWAEAGAEVGEVLAAGLWLLLILALAVLSKENGVLLAWLLAVLEVSLFQGRWAGRRSRALLALGWVALLAPIVMVGLMLWLYPAPIVGGYAVRDFTLGERLMTQSRLLWTYLRWLLLPDISAMGFQHDDVTLSASLTSPLSTVFSMLGWAGALLFSFVGRQRYPLLFFTVLFYLVAHSMESSILPLEMVYEHRNYLPSVAVCLLLVVAGFQLWERVETVSAKVPVAAALLILAGLLFMRTDTWSDEQTLAWVNLDNHPNSARSNYFFASAMLSDAHRSVARGEPVQAQAEKLLQARHYFELMHLADPEDISALVLLHNMDHQYFPELLDSVDWLALIERSAQTRQLQAADYNGLTSLIECFNMDLCQAEPGRVLALLDGLMHRYPEIVRLIVLRYEYLNVHAPDPDTQLALLRKGLALSPGNRVLNGLVISHYNDLGDVAGMYEGARHWLEHDKGRRQLPVITGLFATDEASQ